MNIAQAAKEYSKVYGYEVTPEDLTDKQVHYPLGQHFWRDNEISESEFCKLLEVTVKRQTANAERNDAKLARMAERAGQKSDSIQSAGDDRLSPFGW